MFERTLMALAAGAAIAAAAAVSVVSAAFAVFALLSPSLGAAGASAAVAALAAAVVAMAGMLAAGQIKSGAARDEVMPPELTLVEKVTELIGHRPILAATAAAVIGFFALRNPQVAGAIAKAVLDAGSQGPGTARSPRR